MTEPDSDLVPGMHTVREDEVWQATAVPTDPTQPAAPVAGPGTAPAGTGVVQFDVVMRGYDRRQVDEYIAALYSAHAQLQTEFRRGRPGFEALGSRVGEILELAEAEADEMREHARRDAAQTRRHAEAEAEALGAAARRELEELQERRTALLSDLGSIRTAVDLALDHTDVVWPSETAVGPVSTDTASSPRIDLTGAQSTAGPGASAPAEPGAGSPAGPAAGASRSDS